MWKVKMRRAIIAAIVIVVPLTILQRSYESWGDLSNALALIYPLFPGEVLSLLITGGHGGSQAQEWIGLVFGVCVNALVYSAVLFGLSLLFATVKRATGRRKAA